VSFRVEITDSAHEDIARNALWWAEHHSYEQAVRWKDAIYEQLASLSLTPERHAIAEENPDFPFEIREKLVGVGSRRSYRAVFTIQHRVVYVLTVQRGAQDTLRPEDIPFEP